MLRQGEIGNISNVDKGLIMSDYNRIREIDFYNSTEVDFWNKFSGEYTRLVQGRHMEKEPFVSVLLTTYKRPLLLKEAIESVLNQQGFDDFQLIVVDNECAPIENKTETSELLTRYKDDKRVIYYRNIIPAIHKSDTAVSVARSKWIMILHDDDILSEDHLQIMSSIVKKYDDIHYLIPNYFRFYKLIDENVIQAQTGKKICEIRNLSKKLFGGGKGWLGAFIDREKYLSIGGQTNYLTGINDFIMTGTFHYRYGLFYLYEGKPTYYYRLHDNQTTANVDWIDLYTIEYVYKLYDVEKRHRFLKFVWKRLCGYQTLEKCDRMSKRFPELTSRQEELSINIGIDWKKEKKSILYRLISLFGRLYTFMFRLLEQRRYC